MEKLAAQTPAASTREHRSSDPLSDLAQGAAAGDAAAVRALLIEVGGTMLRSVRKVLGANHPETEDVAQEAMLAFLGALREFRGECSVSHFAAQVALRKALHLRRHFVTRDKVGAVMREPVDLRDEPDMSTPHEELAGQQRRRVVLGLLTDLRPEVGETLALHFILDFTAAEISKIFHVPENTVWSRLKKGKKVLRQALAEDPGLRTLLQGGTRHE